ncbi:ATP-dependent Clp protease ATP-binding subunit [bacterium]|nr:ATP-dependent Clp protease ATP-binding subunit [bacterium]
MVFKEGDPKNDLYPHMRDYTSFLKKMERPLVGREMEMQQLMAAMCRPELCNAILLAEAGSGKTALVQGTMVKDSARAYLEVDLPKMISNLKNENEMADKLKQLFNEVERFRKAEGKEIVLFIDEFHQIVQLSPAAVEVLKPLLADSGTRGIRVIAATTYIEFQQYIASNLPLVERLQRINIPEPDQKTVVSILRGMAERYGVIDQFRGDAMFEAIYEYTNRYIPANAQPRKSILMLDSMIGWHRHSKKPINMSMLADVIYQTEGINIAFRVDATKIKEELDKRVFAQDFATSAIENRLQICCADLNNKNKPMSSFLFTGSTGVGKTEVSKQLANVLFQDERSLIRMDMTEYALPESLERFRQELTAAVWTKPYSIVLLDEIEKACPPVTRLLLQVLDDGRLLDRNNREVTFKNAYIIVTTNAGSEIYQTISQYGVDDSGSGKLMEKYDSLIRDSIKGTTGGGKFPPELLGRIDCLVPFQPLSEQTMKRICLSKLNKLRDEIKLKHHLDVKYDKRLVDYIVMDKMTTDSDAGGARAVVSRIEKEITTEMSKFINKNPTLRDGKTMYVCVVGELACENKNRLESTAHVVVSNTPLSGH